MDVLLKEDPVLFEKYSVQDTVITLKHGNEMEKFNFGLGKTGIPLTISGMGKSYVLQYWSKIKYEGYQVIKNIKIGDLASLMTPKSTRSVDIANYLVPYITAYRGGRNESFMYGYQKLESKDMRWIDYDLTSAYTTVMSILGHPDVEKAGRIYDKTVKEMTPDKLLLNYIVLDVEFKFPSNTKYPSIPTRVDDNVDIYPLEGRSTITGSEYLVAKSMGCRLLVKSGVMIPFDLNKKEEFLKNKSKYKENKENKENITDKKVAAERGELSRLKYMSPYRGIMSELQAQRRMYDKKSFNNLMYKLIGNSIYGQVSMGLSGNTSFDIKTKRYVKIDAGELTNPILASYITGFTRAAVSELMHNVWLLKGDIISVTTDGFITNVVDLESKIMSDSKLSKHCLQLYRDLRRLLTTVKNETGDEIYDNKAIEVKHTEKDSITSWKTRGQLGSTPRGIQPLTGFQSRDYQKAFLNELISGVVGNVNSNKKVEFIESGLRTPSTIYKEGGHSLMVYRDKSYSFEYDNKRRIVENPQNDGLLDSVPWRTVDDYRKIRVLKETVSTAPFKEGLFIPGGYPKKYKTTIETGVRSFIKACFSEENRYGIPKDYFPNYDSIIKFIHGYEPAQKVKITKSKTSSFKLKKPRNDT